ncbi:hypothetical protein [Paenibacillus mucilaginosus]|uniref:Uncharacterized protein n=3 Tax=Paenibacillus mucilaginosus TaxID=61624 RepID=H6NJ20_9BACL|nr:hypothetical protein [Paenibacillus mucilaginosus]AEI40134.1 hypothetical protein KNP414_01570 [Paenibacillus mucilaginosus KNP414]AFC28782.1 hypothetical protein PM3016_1876 [Paenibacillus mucilaginosus 3016]AFH60958.1 hypothetical protein B2K_09530 [Paenibacillus mucilaginosus K02]MCG7215736.1 hypothetical protein [Paenibacillus mucilaginosus]WDM29367.1 hypothetical protein KCX80_09490 [Paenibacillus mucilaginosus]
MRGDKALITAVSVTALMALLDYLSWGWAKYLFLFVFTLLLTAFLYEREK